MRFLAQLPIWRSDLAGASLLMQRTGVARRANKFCDTGYTLC
ncbi:hypothetical protein ACOCF9_003261 [Vibrio cholerae]